VTVADIVADGLRRAGVARVFCADDADATLTDAIRTAGLTIVAGLRRASACAMATVTGRLGDAPGVAIIGGEDSAVGAALAVAARDYAPAIVLASRPPVGVPSKTTVVAGADSAAHWIAHAAQAAMSEPPGCVWLTVEPGIAARAAIPVATVARPPASVLTAGDIDALARTVGAATRPILVAGHGCRAPGTAMWLRAFAEAMPAPVVMTRAGRGTLPDPHPLCHGLLDVDTDVVRRADLVIALGVDDAELAATGVSVGAPTVRVDRVAAVLEELAPRLRDRSRADWDVAELDRLRRARAHPVVHPALATLVTRLREATPVGTMAVFAPTLDHASLLWHAVQPGDVLMQDEVVAASAAAALERPESLVLAFPTAPPDHVSEIQRVGVDVGTPAPAALGAALETALARSGPRVIVVPLPREANLMTGRV
jgi:thiamine pyrophosphate-dependent acetolactate synthase large subunit-like protein